MTITKMDSNMQATVDFTRRGWSKGEICKLEGKVCTINENGSKTPHILISGNWNEKVYVQRVLPEEQEPQCIFTRNPYPEQWKYMYGMSHFSL